MQKQEITADQIEKLKKCLTRGDQKKLAALSGLSYDQVRSVLYQYQKGNRAKVMKYGMLVIEDKLKEVKDLKKQIA